jgi:hypothetical protein
MNNRPFILAFVVVVFVAGGLLYLYNSEPVEYGDSDSGIGEIICTADAMLCPDGTYVGRSGPNCEFLCPSNLSTETSAEVEALCEGGNCFTSTSTATSSVESVKQATTTQ